MSKALLTGLFVFAVAGLTLGCAPDVPANPTYTNHVAAILDAHCARCHGANDMLATMPVGVTQTAMKPNICYLNRYDDVGDCSAAGTTCQAGAGNAACAPSIPTYIDAGRTSLLAMPPLPSEPLNDWEKDVLKRWVAHGAPK